MTGRRKGYIDLGAEMLGVEKGLEKIAVEIKSFLGLSDLDQFEDALGQFNVSFFALKKREPERVLFLAVPQEFFEFFFKAPFFVEIAAFYKLKTAVFDEKEPKLVKRIR